VPGRVTAAIEFLAVATQWSEIRRDFPALARCVYLNAAAASPTPRPVRAAVEAFYRQLEEEGDAAWDEWMEKTEAVRARVARFVGAEADEVAFVPNTSTGINLIVDLLAEDGPVLAVEPEFPAVTLPWIHHGVEVRFVAGEKGALPPAIFAAERAPAAATIAVSQVQFSNGCRLDLDALGALKGGRSLVVCGSQSAGAFPVDVARSGIDAFATAGHKWMCAGYGAGFVVMRRELLARRPPRAIGWLSVVNPFAFDNRRYRLVASARRTESGCPPFAAIFALGAAVDYLSAIGIEAIAERVLALNTYLTDRLRQAGFDLLSPGGEFRSGETLCAAAEPRRTAERLRARGVHVTEKPEGVRIATHFYNDEADVDACVAALAAER
jgi:cysteine desulfurase/selenocysteine lyase